MQGRRTLLASSPRSVRTIWTTLFVVIAFISFNTASAEACGDSIHWYVQAVSGCCAVGTTINTTVPTNWSAQQPNSTSDIAAWLTDSNDYTIQLEGGYFTGYWIYGTKFWTNGLLPYFTTGDGKYGGTNASDYLVAATNYYFTVVEGTSGYYEAGWNTPQDWRYSLGYSVPNGINNSQGEVIQNDATWMGYGPGSYEPVAAEYCLGSCTSWANWGYINPLCVNSPYLGTTYDGHTYGARGPG